MFAGEAATFELCGSTKLESGLTAVVYVAMITANAGTAAVSNTYANCHAHHRCTLYHTAAFLWHVQQQNEVYADVQHHSMLTSVWFLCLANSAMCGAHHTELTCCQHMGS